MVLTTATTRRLVAAAIVITSATLGFGPAHAVAPVATAALRAAVAAETSPTFSDVGVDHDFYAEIEWLAAQGITTGWELEGGIREFRPSVPIERAAMAAFLYRFAGEPAVSLPDAPTFSDVGVDHDFYAEIEWLAAQGITTGWELEGGIREFRPSVPIERAAMAAFLYRYHNTLNEAPLADAGNDQLVGVGAKVMLDGFRSSDPDSDSLTFVWTQTSGPTVTLEGADTATPTFVAPVTAGVLEFSLVVSDGTADSPIDTVTVTVEPLTETNVARTAAPTVTASSENLEVNALATAALDGSKRGAPGDPTREWATNNVRTGAWIELRWSNPVTINRVVLYDRPNLTDRVTAGTLTFSSGPAVAVGSLANAGTATTVTFSPRTVTSLRFTVTSVAAGTTASGLSELEVFGVESPSADAGEDLRLALGDVVLDGSGTTGGAPLSWIWQQVSGPEVALTGSTTKAPSFRASAVGTYTFRLTAAVGANRSTDEVTVTIIDPATNQAPRASAGPDQTGATGVTVTLDGSGSEDPDGHPLSWAWAQTGGAPVELSDPTAASPSFVPDLAGNYSFEVTVSDGLLTATDAVAVDVMSGGTLTIADVGLAARATADFDPAFSGKTVQLQVQTIVTTLTDQVTRPTWTTVATGTANGSGDVTLSITNPLEVGHLYRAVANPTGAAAFTAAITYAAPRPTVGTGLPTVYLNTNESQEIDTRYLYLEGEFAMTAGPNVPACRDIAPTLMKARGRGHSTWEMDKKPYNINLGSKMDICGMGSSKKWALLANADDFTLLRNATAYYLGGTLNKMPWVPKSVPVDLVLNGQYVGSYQLIERVAVAKNRVNITELKDNQGGANDSPPEVTGGYLLEWDFRTSNDHSVQAGARGWVGIKEPEDEDDGSGITDVQVDWVNSYLDEVDAVLFGANFTDPTTGWRKYIDAASAVDYYIAMEVTKPDDGNMYTSVYMYKQRDPDLVTPGDQGKLFFGPMWDFDCSMGLEEWARDQDYPGDYQLPTGWYLRDSSREITLKQSEVTWFNRLNQDPAFRAMVAARWREVYPQLLTVDAFIAGRADAIEASAARDAALWGVEGWSIEVDYLRSWLQERLAWMNAQY